jgi:hypothetical protein
MKETRLTNDQGNVNQTTMGFHFTPVEWLSSDMIKITHSDEDVERGEISPAILEDSMEFIKKLYRTTI